MKFCARCKCELPEDDAGMVEEAQGNFGGDVMQYPTVRVCDDCYNLIMPDIREMQKSQSMLAAHEAWKDAYKRRDAN